MTLSRHFEFGVQASRQIKSRFTVGRYFLARWRYSSKRRVPNCPVRAWRGHFYWLFLMREKNVMQLSETPTVHETALLQNSTLGSWTEVESNVSLRDVELGAYSQVGQSARIASCKIGKFCTVGEGVRIHPTVHPSWRASQHPITYLAEKFDLGANDAAYLAENAQEQVTIGHDVHIGAGAVIMPGSNVGTGAVVVAGAVVAGEVEPYTVVAGTPATRLNRRFSPDHSLSLLEMAWWDWSHDVLKERLADMRDLAIDAFVEKFAPLG